MIKLNPVLISVIDSLPIEEVRIINLLGFPIPCLDQGLLTIGQQVHVLDVVPLTKGEHVVLLENTIVYH